MGKYTVDFKEMVVNDHVSGMSKEAVAAKYNVAPSSVALWTRQYRTDNQPSVSREEYLEQQELNRLRIDNQIFAECKCTRFSSVSERIDEVLRLKDKYNVHALCRVLDVNILLLPLSHNLRVLLFAKFLFGRCTHGINSSHLHVVAPKSDA